MMIHKQPEVVKADGSCEPFNPEKLRVSLSRSSASTEVVEEVLKHTERELAPGMTTAQIYKHAFFLLHKLERPAAKRYSLRRAVMDLGPTGFPFEKYVAEIFKDRGYTTLTGQIVKGGCVEHEIDIVAWNDAKLIMAEAKFHNEHGTKTDLKVVLYVKARFDDLRDGTYEYGRRRSIDDAWLITNTKFTTTAIEYGMCKGLTMIGWNFPEKGSLQEMIEDGDLHPITCLTTLSRSEMRGLVKDDVVLCRQIKGNPGLLSKLNLSKLQIKDILDEINQL